MNRDLSRYRPNVGVMMFNSSGRVWLGRRVDAGAVYGWQAPQGGVDPGEDLQTAALRELEEETGVAPRQVAPLSALDEWLTYDFPPDILAKSQALGRSWIGQKQKWFAVRLKGSDADIDLTRHPPQEFDAWEWAALTAVPARVIPWKRHIYERLVQAFGHLAPTADG
ncbi:MAG: RNA pyrophosphohydrolase [Maricaulaceae bacterium]